MRLTGRSLLLTAALFLPLAACEPASPPPAPEAPPPAVAPSAVAPSAQAVSCRDEIGQTRAEALVMRCIAVSPATRPPCNVANPCALIQGEIDRSCSQYGPGETKPKECTA